MRTLRPFLSLIVPLLLVATWFLVYAQRGAENSFVADPRAVWEKVVVLRAELAANALLSLRRILFGVVAGTTLGVAAGVVLGRRPLSRRLLSPMLNVMTAVPIIVLIPFFLMVFGFGEWFRVAVVAAVVLLLVYQAVFSVTIGFPTQWLELAAHREKTEWQIVSEMLLPSALPNILRALRLSLLFSWLAIALAEKAVAQWPKGGLGYQIMRAREQGLYDELFAAVIVLGAIAFIVDAFVGWVERASSHWRDASGGLQ